MTAGACRGSALAVLLALLPGRVAAAEPLDVDLPRDVALLAVAAVGAAGLALAADGLTPDRCRICAPGILDAAARRTLRWDRHEDAAVASDLLANGVLPGAILAHAALGAWSDGGPRERAEDLLAVAEAVALSMDLNLLVKGATGRVRPSAWADGRLEGTHTNRSFYSGHTALAFSLAASAGMVSALRGRPAAPWIWAVGMSLAATVGYLRVAADAHWLTDVLVGAAVGGAVGAAVPWTLHRRRSRSGADLQLALVPGGFSLRW